MAINWYPGHMHKATKELKEILPSIDIIIEVLDARIPYSSENPVIRRLKADKPAIKLLNKSDLADPEKTKVWIDYIDKKQNHKAMAISQGEPERVRAIMALIKKLVPRPDDAVGHVNALIMGIPNVGKSTIINTLAGRQIAKTGNEPAVTKGQQKINLHNGIMLFDSPGILWPKFENQNSAYRLAATGAIKNTAMSADDVGFFAVEFMLEHYPDALKKRYQMQSLPATELEFLEILGRQRGCLAGGGLVDLNKISEIVLTEMREARIAPLTMEMPEETEKEEAEVEILMAQEAEAKSEKKRLRQQKASKRRR